MKTKKLIFGIVFFVTATLAVIAWRSLPDNRPATLQTEPPSVNIASQNEAPSSGLPSNSVEEASFNPSTTMKVTNRDLTVEIREYDLNPDNPTITICADLPSVADWLPFFSATYNGEEVGVWMVGLIDPQNTAYQEKNRCYLAKLVEGVFDNSPSGKLIFTLDYFKMSLPEQLPEDIITKANEKTKASGIEFEVQNVPHTQIYVITKKPDSISEQAALQAVQKAIQDVTDIVRGPWVLTIDLDQKGQN